MRKKILKWLIGNKPVIANVTIQASSIKASEPEILIHQSNISEVKQHDHS